MTTTISSVLPPPASVANLLTGIIGRPVAIVESGAIDLNSPGVSYFALYRDDMGTAQFACVYDLSLAAHAGAALGLVPPLRARQGVAAGSLETCLEENIREIFNLQSRLFNPLAKSHIHLSEAIGRADSMPDRLGRLMPACPERVDYEVQIHGYGGGLMTIVRLTDPLGHLDDRGTVYA